MINHGKQIKEKDFIQIIAPKDPYENADLLSVAHSLASRVTDISTISQHKTAEMKTQEF